MGGVNHILGWYYGKLSWNRMWCHSINLTTKFAAGPRRNLLQASGKTGFKIREFRNGKEISRSEVTTLSKALPSIEIDKDISM
ncbi:unnamed protein product [Blepharisma stoltei]|uniref:Uncharacterized protein n=1 Tax=Blepharisma stoltei TaxID=1481888 RepID=A0AAU9JHY5_9CILI|nr:unnamed protein product [Blepharisma stoltei]